MPPAEMVVKMESPQPFVGHTVNDAIEAYLSLLEQYKKGQIRHNDLVDWLHEDLTSDK